MAKFALFVFVAIAFVLEEVTARNIDAGVIASPLTDRTWDLRDPLRRSQKLVKAANILKKPPKKNGVTAKDIKAGVRTGSAATAAANAAKEVTRRLYKELSETAADAVSEAVARVLADGKKPSPKTAARAAAAAATTRRGTHITAKIDAYIRDDRHTCPLSSLLQLFRLPLQDMKKEWLDKLLHSTPASTERGVTDAPEPSSINNTQIKESEKDEVSLGDGKEDSSLAHEPQLSEVVKHREREEEIFEGDEEEDEDDDDEDDDEDDYEDEDEYEDEEEKVEAVANHREKVYEESDYEDLLSKNAIIKNINENILARRRNNLYPPLKIHQIHPADDRRNPSHRRFRYGLT